MPALSPISSGASANRSAELFYLQRYRRIIGGERNGSSERTFVRDIAALDVTTSSANRYGGSVPDGIAIYNAIKRHQPESLSVSTVLPASPA